MVTVGGDAYIALRANVGIGPYEHQINRLINRNLSNSFFDLVGKASKLRNSKGLTPHIGIKACRFDHLCRTGLP